MEISRPSILVADAGQFFEYVDAQKAIGNFTSVAEKSPVDFVGVKRGKKRVVRKAKGMFAAGKGFVVFEKEVLIQAFISAVSTRACLLGDCVMKTSGIATGGLMSKLAASVVMCCAEHRWQKDKARLREEKFIVGDQEWFEVVTSIRYVDDIFMASRRL